MGETLARDSPPRAVTVGDRLGRVRRRRFAGRAAELELFRGALEAPVPPFNVLWVHGVGGVGKTTLVGALAEVAERAGLAPVQMDLRGIEPSPRVFEAELARALGVPEEASPLAELAGWTRPVLLLDTFEAAVALEDWVRERLAPSLPVGGVLVIAGRDGPGVSWRRDAGWRDLLRVMALRNLEPEDSRAYLRAARIPEVRHDEVLELTHGHPLALSLLVDVLVQRADDSDVPLKLGAVPDVVAELLESFLAAVPSPRHRFALELVAHARFTTAGQLRDALGDEVGDELFAWLRRLSFIECGPHGLFAHELVREVIDADLRWRDPAAYEQVHRRVRRDVVARMMGAEGREQQRAFADLMFLHRGNPNAPAFWDWESLGEVYADRLRPGDAEAIRAMVELHEGPESAALAASWLEEQPYSFAAFRGAGAGPLGFIAQVTLHDADPDLVSGDPGARAVWAHAQRHAPPRPGEEVLVARFSMDRDVYQVPSRSFNVVTMCTTQEWVGRPRLAWYYLVFSDPEAVAPLMHYIDFQRVPDADFDVGGRRYGVFGRDWRRSDAIAWLELMEERELRGDPAGLGVEPVAAPLLALSQPEFAAAVRRALRDLHDADALTANPLARARVVRERDSHTAGEALRSLVEEAVSVLRGDPREAKAVRALERTYVRPAPTQESAAELLGLPFSTYRGHLSRGVERVVDWLWQRELYGADR
jgi:hypothetical protein